MIVRALFLMCLFFSAKTAFASSLFEARQMFKNGEYDIAIEMAKEDGSPEGLILAAETLSAKVMLGYVDDAKDSAKQARKWAQQALDAAPESQEARVQYALAYGFETRSSSPFRAWRKNLPDKTLEAIEEIVRLYPDDARGPALLGAWHLGIIRKAGAKNGRKWYDASEEAGVAGYEAALKSAPDDIVIGSNYAVTILALDADKYFERAEDALTHIMSLPARNAVDAEIQKRIRGLLVNSDDKKALQATVLELLDGTTADE